MTEPTVDEMLASIKARTDERKAREKEITMPENPEPTVDEMLARIKARVKATIPTTERNTK